MYASRLQFSNYLPELQIFQANMLHKYETRILRPIRFFHKAYDFPEHEINTRERIRTETLLTYRDRQAYDIVTCVHVSDYKRDLD
jgi:hypothetical protein